MFKKILKNLINTKIVFLIFLSVPFYVNADTLLPGNISTCGELAAPGTYTLTQNISGGSNTCFIISSDNVVINGSGYTISGTGDIAIDARVQTLMGENLWILTDGAHAYTNLVINDLNISGYITGLNISGNNDEQGSGVNAGYAGDAGDAAIYYSYIGSIIADGGLSTVKSYGGVGGNISFTDTNLDISSSTVSALGGGGVSGYNSNGGVSVNYTTGINTNNITLSALSYISINSNSYNDFSGGSWPIFPGNISSCGTLFGSGTYTLTQDITSDSTCFTVSSNNVSVNGNGHSITSSNPSSSFAIEVGNHSLFTLASTTVSNFSNLINSSSSVLVSGNDIDLSNKYINAQSLEVNYTGNINTSGTTLSPLLSFTVNGVTNNNYAGGTWPIPPGDLSYCGTLLGSGTYTLIQDLVSSSTCLTISSDNITIDGNGFSINSATSSNEDFAINVGSHTGFVLASTTVNAYSKFIDALTQVTISGHDIDLSHKYLRVLSLIINATGFINRTGLTSSDLFSLYINGYAYGSTPPGSILSVLRLNSLSDQLNWYSVVSSADGKNIAAAAYGNYIYTSNNFGKTWTQQTGSGQRNWYAISSSADGSRLVAAVQGSYIYTSNDFGVTWAQQTGSGQRSWTRLSSSADGKKIIAAAIWGGVYTSTDYGFTWVLRPSLGNKNWADVEVTASGNKMIAADYSGTIYISSDNGESWTSVDPGYSGINDLSSSADGSKISFVIGWANVYTSLDGGNSWSVSNIQDTYKYWNSVSTSYDGKIVYAVSGGGGEINRSIDYGVNWETLPNTNQSWSRISSSANGGLLYGFDSSHVMWQYQGDIISDNITIINPTDNSSMNQWSPYIYWSDAVDCKYSYDNWSSSNDVNCHNNGSDILSPGYGSHTLYLKSVTPTGSTVYASSTFNFGLPISIINPSNGTTSTSWSPSIDWDPQNSGNITSCLYSYDNWTSTSTADCNSDGSDILPPNGFGTTTIYFKVYNSDNQFGSANVTFVYNASPWFSRESNRNWFSITSSSDGNKLASVVYGGYVYTSTDSGISWTQQTSSGSRNWYGITSSSDGTKLAAVVKNGQIYTSTTSGATWVARDSNRNWDYITSSADGTKLAATVTNGNIYTSTTSGATWVAQTSAGSRNWHQITSSADGTRLAAVAWSGHIYVSSSSGVTWATSTLAIGTKNWWGITMTSDGQHIAAIQQYGGNVYTSDDYGVTWNARQNMGAGYAVTYSADGSKLIAAVGGDSGVGPIYVSSDYGVTWTTQESNRRWYSIASSANGNKLAAVVYGGKIYTSTNSISSIISIVRPSSDSSVLSKLWSVLVNWGSSVSCYYSYNNWVSSSTANCSSYGSDILKPLTDGMTTLYIRSIDSLSNQYNQAVSFEFEPWTARDVNRSWLNIDASFDGTKMIALSQYNNVYTSTTTGVSWVTNSYVKDWRDVSSSVDGTKLIAVSATPATAGYGVITYSTTSGNTWATSTIPAARDWTTVDSSDSGQYAVAGAFANYLYVSSDYGATWTVRTGAGTAQWYASAVSSDGSTMAAAAAVGGSRIWFSKDFGSTWTATGTSAAYQSIAMSANGNLIVAVPASNGQPYFGTYSNGSWSWVSKGPVGSWWGVDVSPDGTKIVITSATSGYIYLSEDGGNTWSTKGTTRNWRGVKFIGDTKKFVAVANSGQIYNSFSIPYVISPTNGAYLSSWSPSVSWDRSVTCQYSYDNNTWSNASCTGTGSDINPPQTSGSKTLYIKATDFEGTISTSSISFDYVATISNTNNIDGCGKISSSGTYVLTQDINDISGTCFIINANDVIIDGSGHTLFALPGNNNYAINASSSQNLKLQNINFSGFSLGNVYSTSSVEYMGNDVDLSNSTTTVNSLKITYSNTLTAVNTYLNSLSNIIINGVDLWSFATAGIFTWSQQDISTCMTITLPGYYKLTQDISNISGTCFDIQSRFVIIDGDNHTLTAANGNNNFAFIAKNTPNINNRSGGVALKNITISGFGGGIDARSDSVNTDYVNQYGTSNAVNGTNISLYNVHFPINKVSVNASGGNGFLTDSISDGGNSGNLSVNNSSLGSVILNGGNSIVPQNLGINSGTHSGGLAGNIKRVNSTISSITANSGSSAIPGCMNSDYFNYNSSATYDDGSCSTGIIGLDVDNPLNNTVNGPIDFYLKSNHGVVNGSASYYGYNQSMTEYGSSYNYGTTTGYASFVGDWGSNGGGNDGYVGGGAYFENTRNGSTGVVDGDVNFFYATNMGLINGNVNFNGYSDINNGTINGNVKFTSGYQRNNGTINGNADFSDSFNTNGNINYGTVNGDATFYYAYENQGIVTGNLFINYGCLDPAASNYYTDAVVYNDGYCEYIGSQQSNYSSVRGPITFSNGYNNYGTVNGGATFNTSSYNQGTVNGTTTFNSTYNYGTVQGDAIFNDVLPSGIVTGNVYTNMLNTYGTGKLTVDGINIYDIYWINDIRGKIYDVDGTMIDTVEFLDNTGVSGGTIYLNAIFRGNSYNYGYIYGNVIFEDYSANYGEIAADSVVFNNFSINQGAINSTSVVTFNDYSTNRGGVINGDIKLNTYGYAEGFLPTNGVLKLENIDWNGVVNGDVYDQNDSLITRYEFYNYMRNFSGINGNAIFYDWSYNNAPVNGDVTFSTNYYGPVPTSTVMYISNSNLDGNVSGKIFSSDGATEITDFIFSNNSSNGMTINGNAVFYDSSLNNATINGNATFNNTSPFTIGTVNGNVTLNGLAQTIHGINNVQNLTKSSGVRDVLFIGGGSILNISGLLTLTGSDQNNLLTIKSIIPGTYADININGSSTLNYLRLKDIRNNSSLVNLTNNTVFDDGNNQGFVFKINSTPGTRGGITGSFTAPSLPVSRGGAAPVVPSVVTTNNNRITNASPIAVTLDRFINPNIKPLEFKPTQNFNILNNANIGTTFIPNPLSGIKAPTAIDFIKLPVNFLNNVKNFTLNALLKDNKNYSNSLTTYLYNKGFNVKNEQDLARLKLRPVLLNTKDNVYDDVFKIANSQITYDPSVKSVVQRVRIPINTYTSLESDKVKSIKYFNKDFNLTGSKIDVLSPDKPGIYVINSSNIPLILDVYEPVKETDNTQKESIFKKIIKWTKNVFK